MFSCICNESTESFSINFCKSSKKGGSKMKKELLALASEKGKVTSGEQRGKKGKKPWIRITIIKRD